MAYPVRFARMPERLPPVPEVAKRLDVLRENLRRAGVPERFWRYDLPEDPRLVGIRAYNRGVAYWNAKTAEEQRRTDEIGRNDGQ